jgi:hypothetical protein
VHLGVRAVLPQQFRMPSRVAIILPLKEGMSSNSINPLSSSYLQSILAGTLQSDASTANNTGNSLTGIASPGALLPDNSRLSPLAQLMSTLQQLQQSDPTKYQQVTQQIATNLESAAQTAQSDGNTTLANQLNQLSSDFTSASKSGQMPNIRDLAQAVGGHHHGHHHHAHVASADSDGDSAASSNASNSNAPQTLSQLLSALQANGTQNDALNPLNIIRDTLANAGNNGSNS